MAFQIEIEVKRSVIIRLDVGDLQSMIDALTSVAARPAITGAAVLEDLRPQSANTYILKLSKPDP